MSAARSDRRPSRPPRPGSVEAAAHVAEVRRAELAARVADLRARIAPGLAVAALVRRAPTLALMVGRGAVTVARAYPVATGAVAGAATAALVWRRWSVRRGTQVPDTGPVDARTPPTRLDHAVAQGVVLLDAAIRAGASEAGDAVIDAATRTVAAVPGAVDRHPLAAVAASALAGAALAALLPIRPGPTS